VLSGHWHLVYPELVAVNTCVEGMTELTFQGGVPLVTHLAYLYLFEAHHQHSTVRYEWLPGQ
jgi:hypothetical protein